VINTYFSLIYLLGYVITFSIAIFSPMIPVSNPVRQMLGLLILAYFNLAPIIWVYYLYLPYTRQMKRMVSERIDFRMIFDQYKITKREEEIIELLLEGKTNGEIQGKLFISFHTVKNHLSNIYRKFKVKSRHELVHFFVQLMK
jgi:DNA-binding CsgD family transcriptional regulator